MSAPGVRVYPCPGNSGLRSLYPDLRDCPERTSAIELGVEELTRTRFLGSRSMLVPEDELELLRLPEVPKPDAIDTRRHLSIGLAAFAFVLLLLLFKRRSRS